MRLVQENPSVASAPTSVSGGDPVSQSVAACDADLRKLSLQIHDNPELSFQETQAHDNITTFLERKGFPVVRHAFGLKTSFTAEYGHGGRLVTYCAEYDALPRIGHGCGHNLIATSSIAAFLGAAEALRVSGTLGRVRLLGCPAEEVGGGKIQLLKAGAFIGVDAALMIHPTPQFADVEATVSGVSYTACMAACAFDGVFAGQPAHGAAAPWVGINAMDAASLVYTAIGLKRQQMWPTDRVQINIQHGGTALNVIPELATLFCCVRAKNTTRRDDLRTHIENCLQGAATATGCGLNIIPTVELYADIRPNEALCQEFSRHMRLSDKEYLCDLRSRYFCSFGTDMGNVSHDVPSLHGTFTIPTDNGVVLHSEEFAKAARSPESHSLALDVGRGMAAVGLRVLQDDDFAPQMWENYAQDEKLR